MRQAAMLIHLELTRLELHASALKQFDSIKSAALEMASPKFDDVVGSEISNHPVLSRIIEMSLAILNTMGMPVMGGGTAVRSKSDSPRSWTVGLPAIAANIPAPYAALRLACSLMNELTAGRNVRTASVLAEIQKLGVRYSRLAPSGFNTRYFLQAAHEMEIPWRHVANNTYQFGWGSRSRWIDSTCTQDTSNLSVRLVRDKEMTASVLKRAGLPVPRHFIVGSSEAAVDAAKTLGYPVVVKAANLDGGHGIHVGLKSDDDVRKAYDDVSTLTDRILVEQYIEGNDYRLQVYNDEVYWVIHRKPAGVYGDGASSIATLIEHQNCERKSALAAQTGIFQPILIDDEVRRLLRDQGYEIGSIPAPGDFVRLRGISNVSRGGTLQPALEIAHPDNIALAVRAVRALRLDIAAIDLLIPDISKSWVETGAAICEVNAKPQVSPHIPAWLMSRWFSDGARIPIIATVGDPINEDWYYKLRAKLNERGVKFGVARKRGVELTGNTAVISADSLSASVDSVLGDTALEFLLIVVEDLKDLNGVSPVDRLDLLVCHQNVFGLLGSGQSEDILRQLEDISAETFTYQRDEDTDNVASLRGIPLNGDQIIEKIIGLLK